MARRHRVYDKPLKIQRQDPSTEEWVDAWDLHACVNRSGGGTTPTDGGAERFERTLTFELRWFPGIEEVADDPSGWRVVYRGHPYDITDYDDFFEGHRTAVLTGRRS